MAIAALIDVDGLAKAFGERPVVENVALSLAPGEIVALVGAPGGGKTTTLRMIAGLLRPDRGRGQVLGEDVLAPQPERRGRIGYMGQRLGLFPDLTVLQNLSQSAEAHGVLAAHRAVAGAVEHYGLRPVLDTRFSELTGGWARRVQFVATVIHRPRLLLLDEPTSGFDTATRHDIWEWLEALTADGIGIVVSTRDPAEVRRCRSIVLYRERRALPQRETTALLDQAGAGGLEAELAPFINA
ncbi:MAG: hypothetical protein A4S12_05555 [Proteobacteria bacterium SG_bin5]|nr:ABC transporter ATP-binding protein [Sphingomonas sp.]OQW43181.1 MAG: hypothetical protein A4S12_05555 [Proteobacteria bacterium SG_bin5]